MNYNTNEKYDSLDSYLEYTTPFIFKDYKQEEDILPLIKDSEEENNRVIYSVFDGEEVKDRLYRIRFLIKELGHILYKYRDLKIPGKNSSFYNSYNHYYRMLKLGIEKIEPVEFYGWSSSPLNLDIGIDIKKKIKGIYDFCFKLELLELDNTLKHELDSDDACLIKDLNRKMYDIVMELTEKLAGINYYRFYDTTDIFDSTDNIEHLFTLPE